MIRRRLLTSLCLALPALLGPSCGDSLEPEEATELCNEIREREPACFTEAVMQACVACHQDCGRECARQESCPLGFACD